MSLRLPPALLALGLVATITGCSASLGLVRVDELTTVLVSDVDPESMPAFLDTPQQEADLLPESALVSGLDPSSSRFQGEVEGQQFYLATGDGSTVRILSNDPNDPDGWGWGGSIGNVPIGTSLWLDDDTTLVYLPQGSDNPPDGWHAFSDWMIIQD